MRHGPLLRLRQSGFALWLLVFALGLGLSYAYFRAANSQAGQTRRDAILATRLLLAKEALLARAVNDQNRPGSLPCPDIATNSQEMNNFPGDGRADMLAGNHCPAYVGWLPWMTLDLPELTDNEGNHFWYALSPSLRDDDSAQPINAATNAALIVDDQVDIAAVIIAPGAPLGPQQRPSNRAIDYLEAGNGPGNTYVGTSSDANFNDRLMTISRAELMAAVGKRLAGELKNCLEKHADASTNIEHRYPWPAPFAEPNLRGHGGAHFGRVALTEADSGPETALRSSIDHLETALQQISASSDSNRQLESLTKLDDAGILARNLLQNIFVASSRLKNASDSSRQRLEAEISTINAAIANGRISRSEGTEIRDLGENSNAGLDTLPQLLGEFGFDPFARELAQHRMALSEAQTPASLLAEIDAMRNLLSLLHSPRQDIAAAMLANNQAAANADEATRAWAAAPENGLLRQRANATLGALLESSALFTTAIEASRVNITASKIDDFTELLESTRNSLNTPAPLANRAILQNALTATRHTVANIDTGITAITAARAASLDALDGAILTLQSSPFSAEQIDSDTRQAIALNQILASRIAANEASDNNLTRTSLLESIRTYRAAGMQFATLDTATPRPLQSDLVRPAETLGDSASAIQTWLQIIATYSTNGAQAARALPGGIDQRLDSVVTLENSAYAAAVGLLAALPASREALRGAIDRPSSETRRRAGNALNVSLNLARTLIERTRGLTASLPATTASAFPVTWHSRHCDFLLAGQSTWWNDNGWSESLFYQFGNPLKSAPGTLSVNGSGNYRLIVLAGGPALASQNRHIQTVANFLEGINAAPSRDGTAHAPSKHFSGAPAGLAFNDRLAY